MVLPSGLIKTELMPLANHDFIVPIRLPLFIDQILIVLSLLPDTIVPPSGLIKTEFTSLVCPFSVLIRATPFLNDQILIVLSPRLPPDTMVLPSGLILIELTARVCPCSVLIQISMVLVLVVGDVMIVKGNSLIDISYLHFTLSIKCPNLIKSFSLGSTSIVLSAVNQGPSVLR